jgi:adenosine deaminase CECR1
MQFQTVNEYLLRSIQGSLAQNSVRWSVFEDQSEEDWLETIEQGAAGTGIRAKHIQEWNAEWEDFCQWVVDEYEKKSIEPREML